MMNKNKRFTIWWRSSSKGGISTYFKYRRVKEMDRLMQGKLLNPFKGARILDLGCGMGVDFIRFLSIEKPINLYGLDLTDTGICAKNFNMVVGDAEHIDFPDNYFHHLVSIGVLEHIQPIEKLSKNIDSTTVV
jgi:ubiquinone/menaquinone biosynthesis C-methylase UbiE